MRTATVTRSRYQRYAKTIRVQQVIILALLLLLALSVFLPRTSKVDAHEMTLPEPVPEVAVATVEPTAEVTPEPCPITQDEIVMLAKTLYAESNVLSWRGDQFGVSYKARQAAVAWIALNRYDAGQFGDTLAAILSAPYQFAYSPETEVTTEMLDLAADVVSRWWAEKQGEPDVGRTLPADYYFFHGDGRENYFRKDYLDSGVYWDWSLADPYQ